MSDYDDTIEKNDERYNIKNRNETNKNIKLLNEILVAQKPKPDSEDDRKPRKKRKMDNIFAFSVETLKDPILMIILYVILHTPQINNLFVRYMPKLVTNPENMIVYYGSKGLIYSVLFYLLRHLL